MVTSSTPSPEASSGANGTLSQDVQPLSNGFNVASLILAIVMPVVGLIMGIVSMRRSAKAGQSRDGLALASVWVGSILICVEIAVVVVMFTVAAGAALIVSN